MWQCKSHHISLGKLIQRLRCPLGVANRPVFIQCIALTVHIFSPRCDKLGTEFAKRLKHHFIINKCLIRVSRSIVKILREPEPFLLYLGNCSEIHVPEKKSYIVVVRIKIGHNSIRHQLTAATSSFIVFSFSAFIIIGTVSFKSPRTL